MSSKIKSTKCYATEDGQTFQEYADAVNHQQEIEMRGVIQSAVGGNINGLSTTQVARLIISNRELIRNLINRHSQQSRRLAQKS